jgi:transcriptional regulator with XRE-family HTH domain
VAVRIRELRLALGLRQRDVVRKLDLPQDKVSRWENGHEVPAPDHAIKLAELFGIPGDFFLRDVVE